MTGYTAVGGGVGAGVLADGRLNVVAGSLFARIERERVEGPLYVEALRGARELRHDAYTASPPGPADVPTPELVQEIGLVSIVGRLVWDGESWFLESLERYDDGAVGPD